MFNEMCLKMDNLFMTAKAKVENFFSSEKGEVNIVATVLLIGVACVLVVTFKNEISGLLTSLFQTIRQKATTAVQ